MTNQEAIEILMGILTEATEYENSVCYVTEVDREPLEMAIKALKSQKTGHWIADVDKWGDVVTTINGYKCSECGMFNTDKDNYCPNCGAKMEGE